ncbi:IclR family transcriptional regulator [Jeotgalibacillus proteolyticus]|uniref:IclR family transcriptional regulator n=1 Tax=Jeotgalibacillus proteolyticus TaxID=2082395 RepID=A0A2S5G677_9BACL|nr:IclR family transcriptional regulator [Jeotgalibacillus proteolyticus]PPA68480.1 IclR family transcriptional regulator [Jeotgalibacillus proteolyticus]
MDKKQTYLVPALIKADLIINLLVRSKSDLRATDISKELDISKSSCSVLLKTLETLGWIEKKQNEGYGIGPALAHYGSRYLKDFNLIDIFTQEAKKTLDIVDEHIQLGILQGNRVMYLSKIKGSSQIDLVTSPGMQYPSHSTSVGKVQLITLSYDQLIDLFSDGLKAVTKYTITDLDHLYKNLQEAKKNGYIEEHQESAIGFHCIAGPIYNNAGEIVAGVSIAMTTEKWKLKENIAREEILKLSSRLSYLNGYKQ